MNSEIIKNIRKKIRTRESGPAVESMKKLGINYGINHGVSIIEIKNIAQQFSPNHELAIELWKHNNREFKIIATIIAEPNKLNEEQIVSWISELDNTEIAEQISINLLWKINNIQNQVCELIKIDNVYSKKAIFVLIAQLAMKSTIISDEKFISYFDVIYNNSTTENIFLKKSISLALRKIGRRNKNLNQKSIDLANKIAEINNESAKWISHDVLLEITDEIIKSKFN